MDFSVSRSDLLRIGVTISMLTKLTFTEVQRQGEATHGTGDGAGAADPATRVLHHRLEQPRSRRRHLHRAGRPLPRPGPLRPRLVTRGAGLRRRPVAPAPCAGG